MAEEHQGRVDEVLTELVEEAKHAFGDDLDAIVLFGSAAEGRLRPTSDVNLLMLLKRFNPSRVDALRSPLRVAHAAIRAKVMFLLRDELPAAAELFAVKFNDIATRHRVLYGQDPFSMPQIDPEALTRGLREVLLNLAIRLRERYALVSLREERLAGEIAACAGPLRAAAVALLRLRGRTAGSPREALERIAADSDDTLFMQAVELLPLARQQEALPYGSGGPALLSLSRLAAYLERQLQPGGRP